MNHCWQLNGRGSAVDPTDSGLELLVSLANEVESEQPRHVVVDTSLFEKQKLLLILLGHVLRHNNYVRVLTQVKTECLNYAINKTDILT